MAKYLITGGAGFIGSNIAKELLKRKEEVVILDNLSTGRKKNIREFLDDPKLKFSKGDLRNHKDIERAIKGIDFILHQAAIPSVSRSVLDPKATFEANVLGTLELLFIAREYKVKKVVYASSSSVYGPTKILPKKENMAPNPVSPYALSKLTGEKLCQIFSLIYNIPTVCLRYFNVFGPRQDPTSEYAAVIPKFISFFLKNERPIIFGDGKQTRDFTFIDNVVEANIIAAKSKFRRGEIFNIACGGETSLLVLIDILNEIFSKKNKPQFEPVRVGDVKYSFADISKAKKELNFKPKISLKEGLIKTIEWFKENERT